MIRRRKDVVMSYSGPSDMDIVACMKSSTSSQVILFRFHKLGFRSSSASRRAPSHTRPSPRDGNTVNWQKRLGKTQTRLDSFDRSRELPLAGTQHFETLLVEL